MTDTETDDGIGKFAGGDEVVGVHKNSILKFQYSMKRRYHGV
jgi:hypothetical protein